MSHNVVTNLPGPGSGGHPGSRFEKKVIRPKDSKNTLLRLGKRLGHHKKTLILVVLAVFLSTLFQLSGPWLLGQIIDKVFIKKEISLLLPYLLAMASVYTLTALFTWLQQYIMTGLSQRMIGRLREDMFSKMESLSLRFFDNSSHGDIMSRFTNDLDNLNTTMTNSVIQLFSGTMTLVGTIIIMFILNVPLTIISLLTIPFMSFFTKMIGKRTRKAFRAQQKELGQLNGVIEETLGGQREIIAFGREEGATEDFIEVNNRLRTSAQRAQFYSGIAGPLMGGLSNMGYAMVAVGGGILTLEGLASVGIMASFLSYVRQFNRPLNQIAQLYNTVQSALAGAERIFALLDREPEIKNHPSAKDLGKISGEVIFDKVNFSYNKGQPILKNISFQVKRGEMIAFVGPTGAGKTTMANLLTRFYDIESGQILIDGKDLTTEVTKESLRSKLAIVLQDSFLFSTTVRDNIRYGRLDASDEEVEEAARIANGDHFIRSLPQGYDTELTKEGNNLSQGQKQLLAIARAVLADPDILILDEATSSVDTRTEKHIQEAMVKLMKGRTSFVIAHRLSTIREADRILVISGGEIVEQGNHQDLLAQKGVYHKLYQTQGEGKAI